MTFDPRPSVAIIILNWQNWHDTLACVGSLRELRYDNFNIVVVDNGSTNDSAERIRKLAPDCNLVISERNLGFGGGNNIAIRQALAAGADFIWLLNNDTRPEPQALAKLVECAESDPSIGAVGSVLYYMDNPGVVQAWGGGSINYALGRSHTATQVSQSASLEYLTAASLLLRSSAIDQVGGFDPNFFMYWEDADLCLRLRDGGWKLVVAEDSRVLHRESASLGKKSPLLDYYYSNSVVHFFRKHSKFPVLPIGLSLVGRVGKRLLTGRLLNAWAVLRGTFTDIRSSHNPARH
jgi:GT2 family glycosyltransferase